MTKKCRFALEFVQTNNSRSELSECSKARAHCSRLLSSAEISTIADRIFNLSHGNSSRL